MSKINKCPNDYEETKKMGSWKIGLEQLGKDYIEPEITIYNGIKEEDTETEKIKTELVRVPSLLVTLLYLQLHQL